MNIKVTRPHINDLDNIHQLFSLTIENNFHEEKISDPSGSFQKSIVNDLVNTLKKDYKSNGKDEFHLIAKNEDMIIGIIAFGSINSIIIENTKLGSLTTIPELKSVYVLPNFQNTGIGNILLKNIVKCLIEKGYKEFCLDSGYTNAQRYWKKKFGAPTYILDQYWTPKNDHMIWHVKIDTIKEFFLK